ncbi:hypothetical protein C7E17_01835 [Stenotrophomonas maltophilia]|nr:hypothetical protein C7E17_01835 [Stenotrophomonas maltophilia]
MDLLVEPPLAAFPQLPASGRHYHPVPAMPGGMRPMALGSDPLPQARALTPSPYSVDLLLEPPLAGFP